MSSITKKKCKVIGLYPMRWARNKCAKPCKNGNFLKIVQFWQMRALKCVEWSGESNETKIKSLSCIVFEISLIMCICGFVPLKTQNFFQEQDTKLFLVGNWPETSCLFMTCQGTYALKCKVSELWAVFWNFPHFWSIGPGHVRVWLTKSVGKFRKLPITPKSYILEHMFVNKS